MGHMLLLFVALLGLTTASVQAAVQSANDDTGLTQSADWRRRTVPEIQATLDQWRAEATRDASHGPGVAFGPKSFDSPGTLEESLRSAMTAIFPTTIDYLAAAKAPVIYDRELVSRIDGDGTLPESTRQYLLQSIGVDLARQQRFELGQAFLNAVDWPASLDPAGWLFYHGLCCHQLMNRDECLRSLRKLLLRPDDIPQRYASLAELMIRDIEPLKPDTLDEVARLMDDVRRRQNLYQTGKTVRRQEASVVKKLDKLIEELEQQRQSQQSAGSSSSGQPMQDSMRSAGGGEGSVQQKSLADGGSWGNLPPQQRAAALAVMTKNLPPHFRAVVEEYFRQLAREKRK